MNTEAFEKEYGKLNAAQKKAVDTIEGPVMVIAGPGSGKTQVLSLRVANILLEAQVRPGNILCLTFTDSAAANMRKRLAGMIGQDAYRVFITTFHSFGTDVINRFPEHFYGGARMNPADELVQTETLEGILKSLPYGNPLKSEHPEQGYVYLKDILHAISQLKKAGIIPEEFGEILRHNEKTMREASDILGPVFDARLGAKSFGSIAKALADIESIKDKDFPVPHFKSYKAVLVESLRKALNEAEERESAEPLSKWKAAMLAKTDDLPARQDQALRAGGRALKELISLPKLLALQEIYAEYRKRMFEAGYFDYDDMLLEVIVRLESDETLRAELQEQFQYVLVDEFQDTNDAQMRLLHLLLDAPVNEGRPNVCVVGDDDQAIYKFQGAELGNILSFKKRYAEPVVITMTENYRSTQVILDVARFVIERGEERLERMLPDIAKDLKAANKNVAKGEIRARTFPTESHEYHFIARELGRLLGQGEQPGDIAVIARHHAELEAIVPFLNAARIPFTYERQSNVLLEKHIREIITISRFADTLMQKDREEADHLLPEILSYPFWGIERSEIWKVSVQADRERRLWLDVMLESPSEKIRNVADFFIGLAMLAKADSAEKVLDVIIGSHLAQAPESEYDEYGGGFPGADAATPGIEGFVSPFREFYFNGRRLKENKSEYLVFLSGLRAFIHAVREYKRGELLKLSDLLSFVDLHVKNGIPIPDTSSFANSHSAVTLLTAHKAKGMEWKTVFVLNCADSVWTGRGPGRKLSFPKNLPISPSGDTTDDQLRLFFVALTRAKSNLYLTASETTASGKSALGLSFLLPSGESADPKVAELLKFEAEEGAAAEDILSVASTSLYRDPVTYDEEAMLRSLVEEYQMSVTHLNNFLDVAKGGPILFLEQNLVRFPQEKSLSSKFGTAMHSVIERIYNHLKTEGNIAGAQQAVKWLEYELKRERLMKDDLSQLRERGEKALKAFLKEKAADFKPSDKIEVNFANQGACIGDARITGKIDKMVQISEKEWSVHDFKTGGAETDWEGRSPYEKVKLHHYKYQLIFYKLLVENSREFCDQCVVKKGCLEFLEPYPDPNGRIVELPLDLEDGDVERVSKLAEIVYRKICNLEFPDVSGYSDDLAGIIAFEDDLLEGKI